MFGIFDTYEQAFVATGFATREEALERLSDASDGFGGDISPDVAEASEVREIECQDEEG